MLYLRKNRHFIPSCEVNEFGVDLNRNFDIRFSNDENGSSNNPCSEDYNGDKPFSEPETRSLRDFIEKQNNLEAVINLHSYGNMWIHSNNYDSDVSNNKFKKEHKKHYEFVKSFYEDYLSN